MKAKKSLGQHFLKSEKVLEEIIQVSDVSPEDTVLEVGPGRGALTNYLVRKEPKRLILVEKDHDLISFLQETYGHLSFVEIYEGDILTDTRIHLPKEYKVIANIPYYISTPILKHFLLKVEDIPTKMTLLVQKEFAEKVLSEPPYAHAVSVLVQSLMSGVKVCNVPKGAFSPPPQVDSAVLSLTRKNMDKKSAVKAIKLAQHCFLQARKKLRNSIDKGILNMNNAIEIKARLTRLMESRPEELAIDDWHFLITIIDEYQSRNE